MMEMTVTTCRQNGAPGQGRQAKWGAWRPRELGTGAIEVEVSVRFRVDQRPPINKSERRSRSLFRVLDEFVYRGRITEIDRSYPQRTTTVSKNGHLIASTLLHRKPKLDDRPVHPHPLRHRQNKLERETCEHPRKQEPKPCRTMPPLPSALRA